MSKVKRVNHSECPVETALQKIGGKWKVVILHNLRDGKYSRFSELKTKIPNISSKVLSDQLKDLEKNRLVERQVYPEVPVRVEYSLTKNGKSLIPILDAIRVWGENLLKKRG